MSTAVAGIEDWWAAGERLRLPVAGTERAVFVRRSGTGAPLSLLHGFPSSSHDYAAIAPSLAAHHAVLACDFLGFGASDKPADHVYTIHEQADLVAALWEHEGIGETAVVAHDYAVSVAQELLARQAEGALRTEITSIHFLNGGLYPDLHRLIRYIDDRREHEQRWVRALEDTTVPVAFVWGMLDPISGAHVAQRLAERLPSAPLCALLEVGHWPPIEAPARVAAVILTD